MNVWETLVFFVIIWCIVEVYGAAFRSVRLIREYLKYCFMFTFIAATARMYSDPVVISPDVYAD